MSATRASVASTGWQAVKIRRSEIVADLVVERLVQVRLGARGLDLMGQLLVLALEELLASQQVDRAALGGGHQPCAGPIGHAGPWPVLERLDQRILGEVLGRAHIAHHAREARDEPRRLDPPDRVDGAMGVGVFHERASHHLRFGPRKPAPRTGLTPRWRARGRDACPRAGPGATGRSPPTPRARPPPAGTTRERHPCSRRSRSSHRS